MVSFLKPLKRRGLNGLKMVISVVHAGLVKAIKETFINVSWQRCQVHFLRNILDKTPKKETKEFKEDIKALFRNQDIKIARIVKKELFNKYEDDKKYQASLVILDKGFEVAFTYLNESVVHPKLKTTNCLERLNAEIRRRERVIRIFPNVESAYHFIGAMLINQDEEWLTAGRINIQM